MGDIVREILQHRDLLYMLTWREIKIRYKQSVMGFAWALLMPIVIVGAGVVVRVVFSSFSGSPVRMSDIASVAVKSAPYAFLVAGVRFGTNSLIGNANLLSKVYMPRLVFPLAAVASQLMDFLIASAVLGIVVLVMGVGVSVQWLWLPLLFLGLVMMVVAGAIVFSAASLFFRDVKYLVDVLLTFAVFFVPVVYDADTLGRWRPAILLNPVSPVLQSISDTVVGHRMPDLAWLGYSFAFAVVALVLSVMAFRKLEPLFAESV